MAKAAKHLDPVLGIDIHMVIVPPSPAPVPLPHPFIGTVFDPLGLLVSALITAVFGGGGPVFVNGRRIGNTGTDCIAIPHFPTPPGVSFHPIDKPDNEGTIVTGSKTVLMEGSSEGRFGSSVASCNFPINLPTSMIMPITTGAPVEVGGPEAVDWFAAVTRGIRTKWFSSALHKMLNAVPGGRLSKLICFLTGHPVDVMTGEVLTDAVDFDLPGPLPLRFERNYYSRDRYAGPLGQGWHHPLDAHVVEDDIEVFVRLPDGRERRHDRLQPGGSLWDDIDRYTLSRTQDGYRLTTWEGITYDFRIVPGAPPRGARGSTPFQLLRVSDRCDNSIKLFYAGGHLAEILDSAGRRLQLAHDTAGRLESITHDGATLARYVHDGPHLVAAKDPLNHAQRYTYRGGVLVRETNKNGLSWHFEYDWEDPDGWCVRTWGDGGIYDRRITYDKAKHTTIVDDSRGGRTHYFGNEAGLVDREIDPTGVETRYEWDQSCRKVAEIDGLGNRTEWAYDERGNTVLERNALREETKRVFNALNLPEAIFDAAGGRWSIEYDDRGKPVRLVDPLGHARTFRHDRRGRLRRSEDPMGHSFELAYDERGDLAESKDPEGGCTRYEWDARGRVTAHVDAMGRRTELTSDAGGRLVGIKLPDGGVERRAYDPEGNVTERIDVLGNTTRYRYGGFNKLVEQVDGEGGVVRYHYDTEENLVGLTNELGETYRIDVDLAGRVVREVGFDGRTLVFRYDRAGRCIEMMNGALKITRFERDALGRIVRQLLPGQPTVQEPIPPPEEVLFEYDARGDLVRAKNSDADVVFERDALGRVIAEQVGEHRVESRYDAAGRRVMRRTTAGHVTGYDIDGNGRLRGLSVLPDEAWMDFDAASLEAGRRPERAPWRMWIKRDATGAETERTLPGGVVARWKYDPSGRPAQHDVMRGNEVLLSRAYTWRSDEQIATIIDAQAVVARYEYDRRSYLVGAQRSDGLGQFRSPDAAGNLYRTLERSDRSYGPGGVLRQADGVQFVYDADGNLVERTPPDGQRWMYSWDAAGQLREVSPPNGTTVRFAYDALGRRLRKSMGDQVVSFVWSENDIVCEIREHGESIACDFAYLTFVPVVMVEGNHCYGVVVDHIGAPLLLVDDVGEVAWLSTLDVYGRAEILASAVACPWRWPGQYEDRETELHYNRFRYYDPRTGLYTSPDPIGLAGGWSLYAYVLNPVCDTDPFGLACYKAERVPGGLKIGAKISEKQAITRVKKGLDVIADTAAEAKSIAKRVFKGKAVHDGPHGVGYFSHFHPHGDHDVFGHVFHF